MTVLDVRRERPTEPTSQPGLGDLSRRLQLVTRPSSAAADGRLDAYGPPLTEDELWAAYRFATPEDND